MKLGTLFSPLSRSLLDARHSTRIFARAGFSFQFLAKVVGKWRRKDDDGVPGIAGFGSLSAKRIVGEKGSGTSRAGKWRERKIGYRLALSVVVDFYRLTIADSRLSLPTHFISQTDSYVTDNS